MPLNKGIMTPVRNIFGNSIAISAVFVSSLLIFPQPSFAQSWSRDDAGVFIYQRDVPTQPAQVVGEPAPPDKVILSGPDSPFDSLMHLNSALSDLEIGAISGQAPSGLAMLLPDAPPSGADPQAVVAYTNSLAATVTAATQSTVVDTVNQTTALLNNTTAMISNVLSKLPTPGEF